MSIIIPTCKLCIPIEVPLLWPFRELLRLCLPCKVSYGGQLPPWTFLLPPLYSVPILTSLMTQFTNITFIWSIGPVPRLEALILNAPRGPQWSRMPLRSRPCTCPSEITSMTLFSIVLNSSFVQLQSSQSPLSPPVPDFSCQGYWMLQHRCLLSVI